MLEDHDHSPEAIAARLKAGPKAYYLREWVYGGIDGVVTTFAIIAGVAGASLSPAVILILGLANLIADGFSMAAGAYSATKADADNYLRLHERESKHIDKYREGELEETRQILALKGFEGHSLNKMLSAISKDKTTWIEWMVNEEYGLSKPLYTPFKAAFNTFIAFVICGSAPILPFVFGMAHSLEWALALSALTFFVIGSLKSHWSVKLWWREGLETLLIGLIAAGISYGIGFALKSYIL